MACLNARYMLSLRLGNIGIQQHLNGMVTYSPQSERLYVFCFDVTKLNVGNKQFILE